jgi:micrococcal nuclease
MTDIFSRTRIFLFLLPVFLFCAAFIDLPQKGRVIGVSDGDTMTILHDDYSREKIRLYGIDCPEKKQAFGQRAKQFTSTMVYGQQVTIRRINSDRYGRTVAWVFLGHANVNTALVRAGLAWHYRKYSDDPELHRLEQEARIKKRGLWVDPYPVPPWDYRKGIQAGNAF